MSFHHLPMPVLLATAGGPWSELAHWDTILFTSLNGLHSPFWDGIMAQISGPWVLLPVHLLVLFAVVHQRHWRRALAVCGILLLTIAADLAGARGIKNAVERVRPCNEPALASTIHFVGGHRSGAYSFVSTHTAYAFALAGFALFALRRRALAVTLLGWAAAVGYSRIYLGLHYPGDILGGAAWGMTVAATVIAAISRLRVPTWPHAGGPFALVDDNSPELQPAFAKNTPGATAANR